MSDEYPSPSILDVRRLMGANRFGPREGAVLEVSGASAHRVAQWRVEVLRLAAELGWTEAVTAVRFADGGEAHLFLSAPVDQLMTATAVGELAWVRAARDAAELPGAEAALRAQAAAEQDPAFAELRAAARRAGRNTAFDDDTLILGGGVGVQCVPRLSAGAVAQADGDDHLPHADAAWPAAVSQSHDIPLALVTGSNGKTTTTRLVAAMLQAAGLTAGICGTDGVVIGGETLVGGDYSGPDGARRVLRDPRVQGAVLETARGGILRRGLAVTRADAAIVTNIQADHFGEYGIRTLEELAEVKLVVAHAVRPGGMLVLNAADPTLRSLAETAPLDPEAEIGWFLVETSPVPPEGDPAREAYVCIGMHLALGGTACVARDGMIVLLQGATERPLVALRDVPITLGGAARHNVANALGAVLVARALGVPESAIILSLQQFGRSAAENRGRFEVHQRGGATLVVDYAHNPAGIAALCEAARALPARRRCIVIGQAGNRDDTALRALARAAWETIPLDKVILKRMAMHTRGRPLGETEAILADELQRCGAPAEAVEVVESELAAVQRAVAWAEPGDLVLLTVHADRSGVLAWLETVT